MNHKTLSDFRVGHGAILESVLADSFAALMAAGVAGLERVAQDGVRVRASAGAASFRRHSTLYECRRQATAEVARLRSELDADPGAASRREVAARQRAAEDRARRVENALAVTAELRAMQAEKARKRAAQVAAAEDDGPNCGPNCGPDRGPNTGETAPAPPAEKEPRASTTDAQARVMKMADGGFRPAYNVQFTADTKSGAVANVAVDNVGSDMVRLKPTSTALETTYGRRPGEHLDMVGMTRAHMADPHIVAKIMRGEEDRIRPCVGANYCLDRIYQGGMALCLHNPSTGRELEQPHAIAKADTPRRVVIVGAGPAGLEAARVAAERGHDVVVHEAANDPGGQIRLTAQTPRRAEMMQIIQWRFAECARLGVNFRFNSYADAEIVQAENPDVVIIATGGLPHTEILEQCNDLVASSWDILSGDAKPGENVLIYDDAGDYPALQAAEKIAATGAKVEIMTRDRSFAPEVMAMSLTPSMRELQKRDVTFTVTWKLDAVAREGNRLIAHIGSDYGGVTRTREVDQVIVNHGTRPLDDLYFDLRSGSVNLGEVDYEAFVAGSSQTVRPNPAGAYLLFRIGDAVAVRNTHAAIYDALRLMRTL